MTIHFYCPLGHRLAVPDDRAGKKGRCPMCYQLVIAPVADPRPSGRDKSPSPLKGRRMSPEEAAAEAEDAFLEEMGLKRDDDPYKL